MSLSYPVLEQQPSDKGNDVRFSNTLNMDLQTLFRGSYKLLHQVPDILCNLIVLGYITFYQIYKLFVNILFFPSC